MKQCEQTNCFASIFWLLYKIMKVFIREDTAEDRKNLSKTE